MYPIEEISVSNMTCTWPPSKRHVNHVDARHQLEQLAGDMLDGAVASRSHVEFPRVGLGIGNQFGNRSDRDRRMYFQHAGVDGHARDRGNVAQKIETELVVKGGIDRVRGTYGEERVTVGRGAHNRFGCDVGPAARRVLDDERLAKPV